MSVLRTAVSRLAVVNTLLFISVSATNPSTATATAAATSSQSHGPGAPSSAIAKGFVNPASSLLVKDEKTIPAITASEARTSKKTMIKYIHFVRHAEGRHNVAGEENYLNYMSEDYHDSALSEHGERQCRELSTYCEGLPHLNERVSLLVVSPLLRTLQTASLTFPHLKNRVRWVALECIREQTGLHPCDQRKEISVRVPEFPGVDFSSIKHDADPLYDQFLSMREPDEHVGKRGREFLDWLSTREEPSIVVVTHSAFLRHFFDQVVDCQESDKIKYENCEARTYKFIVPDRR